MEVGFVQLGMGHQLAVGYGQSGLKWEVSE